VRLPRSLHRRLAERAGMEGISLNQFVNVTLAEAVCKG
jgi:predicted HicB family RNase H-like nuclease